MIGAVLDLKAYLDRVRLEIERLDLAPVQAMADLIHQAYEQGRWVFVIGHGEGGRPRSGPQGPAGLTTDAKARGDRARDAASARSASRRNCSGPC